MNGYKQERALKNGSKQPQQPVFFCDLWEMPDIRPLDCRNTPRLEDPLAAWEDIKPIDFMLTA